MHRRCDSLDFHHPPRDWKMNKGTHFRVVSHGSYTIGVSLELPSILRGPALKLLDELSEFVKGKHVTAADLGRG